MLDDQVKINIKQEELVQAKETFNPFEKIGSDEGFDMMGMLEKTQKMATKLINQDSITVPYEEWKQNKINVDDIVVIDVNKEK